MRRIDGYAPVAEIVHAHHERWDGRGYPRGLARRGRSRGAARLIAVADTYDVITARDSYRKPVSTAGGDRRAARASPAASSTRDVVEVFIGLLTAGDLSFGHGDDADFEGELGFGQAWCTRTPSPERGNRF